MFPSRLVRCGSGLAEAALPKTGTVWSSTVVHSGPSPVGLAYVDLLDGPRLLARFDVGLGSPQTGDPAVIEIRDGLPYLRAGGSG